MSAAKRNKVYLEIIRIFAIFLVVINHTCAFSFPKVEGVGDVWYWSQLLFDEIVKMAVPLFFMVQNRAEWLELLTELGKNNITALLLEGGGELAGKALQAKIVDEVEFHIAPKLLCGRASRSVVGGENPQKLAEAMDLDDLQVKRVGCDLIISGKVKFED